MKKTDYLPVKMSPEMKQKLLLVARRKDESAGSLVRRYIARGLRAEERRKRNGDK